MTDVAPRVDRPSPPPGRLPPKPWLVRLGGGYSLVLGALIPVLLIAAAFDVGTYSISGETVSGPVFLRRAGLPFLSVGGLLLGIGFSLRRNRSWSRHLVMVFWLWVVVCVIGAAVLSWPATASDDLVSGLATLGVIAAMAGYYFYRKPNVVRYYEAIERLEREGSSYDAARAQLGPTWWQRHWRWAAPALAVVLTAGLWGGIRAFKSTDIYRTALARAQQDSVVVRELGTIVEDGWFPTGNVTWEGRGGGSAALSIPLSGPKGRGTLVARATRANSVWHFDVFSFTPAGSRAATDLLARETR